MGMDYNYYWDFSKEIQFAWKLVSGDGEKFHYQAEFELEEGGDLSFSRNSPPLPKSFWKRSLLTAKGFLLLLPLLP